MAPTVTAPCALDEDGVEIADVFADDAGAFAAAGRGVGANGYATEAHDDFGHDGRGGVYAGEV